MSILGRQLVSETALARAAARALRFRVRQCARGMLRPTGARMLHLTLFSGTDCQLCDEAAEVLAEVAREVPFTLHMYNIRDDNEPNVQYWRRKYQYEIPVLHGRPEEPDGDGAPNDAGRGTPAARGR